MQQFKNLPELIKHFSEERTCWDYLEQQLWNGRPVCPHCGSTKAYRMPNYEQFHCGNKTGCNKKFTVLNGTMYENTKVPLAKWFAAIWLLTAHKKGISSLQLGRDIGVTQKTAWFMMHRIRLVMGDPTPEPLEYLVEVDETYMGGKVTNMTSKKRKKLQDSGKDNKIPVMGLVQRDGKAMLKVIGNNSFKEVVRKHVDTTAVIVTDSHAGYEGLKTEYAGHEAVNHTLNEYKRDIFYTHTVEGFFSLLKRGVYGIYHQVSAKHLHRYCEEFASRYNSRKIKDSDRFIETVRQSRGRLKYADLIKKD